MNGLKPETKTMRKKQTPRGEFTSAAQKRALAWALKQYPIFIAGFVLCGIVPKKLFYDNNLNNMGFKINDVAMVETIPIIRTVMANFVFLKDAYTKIAPTTPPYTPKNIARAIQFILLFLVNVILFRWSFYIVK